MATDEQSVDAERAKYPILYSLTHLTGSDAHRDRTISWSGFEIKRRHGYIFLATLFPAFIITLVFWPLFGTLAFVIFFMVQGAVFWALEARSRRGLQMRMYKTIYDQHKSVDNMFILCGRPLRPEDAEPGWVYRSSVPTFNETLEETDIDDADSEAIFSEAIGISSAPARRSGPAPMLHAHRSAPTGEPEYDTIALEDLGV